MYYVNVSQLCRIISKCVGVWPINKQFVCRNVETFVRMTRTMNSILPFLLYPVNASQLKVICALKCATPSEYFRKCFVLADYVPIGLCITVFKNKHLFSLTIPFVRRLFFIDAGWKWIYYFRGCRSIGNMDAQGQVKISEGGVVLQSSARIDRRNRR